jgi:hypothetical protein
LEKLEKGAMRSVHLLDPGLIETGAAGRPGKSRSLFMRRPAITRVVFALLILSAPVLARDNGQYDNVSPEVRQWFRMQKSPKTGALCCNEADGTYAEEDIRNGIYWTRFALTKGEWIPVPTEVVIKDPNRNGAPVAWWHFHDGKLEIRCYAPGGGV